MNDQLKEHLRFASELGVAGVSRDPAWRRRGGGAEQVGQAGQVGQVGLVGQVGQVTEAGQVGSACGHAEARMSESEPGHQRERGLGVAPQRREKEAGALAVIRADIGDCTRCKLHTLGRRQVVFGVGNPAADLMFVGEAPGADEDIQGEPFVGRAGQLLTKIIEAIELTREEVYIANVIKCRPPQNRNPEQDEVDTCEPFLFQQIDVIKPRVVVALGTFAARALLRTLDPISRLRGRVFEYRGSKLIPTFHPAYLLRNPASKREVWEDMKLVKRLLSQK